MTYAAIRSPMFLFNGSEDAIVSPSWVKMSFDALDPSIEAYWYEASGAPHIPIPSAWAKESALLWFRWKLLNDTAACERFKALPSRDDWDLKEQRNSVACQ
jgi:hypothetical protein